MLGTGCTSCKKLQENVAEAVSKLGLSADVKKVEDLAEIMGYGVMTTPGLVVDGEVRVSGRVPSVSEIVDILKR